MSLSKDENNINNVKYGSPQTCPKCKMFNPSGLRLPEQCWWCHGTGGIKIGDRYEGVKI